MIKQKIKRMCRSFQRDQLGLTLLELIVTIAVLAIASSLMLSSYANVMEDKRVESDLTKLNNIDTNLQQLLLLDDVFEEVKNSGYVYDDNKVTIKFELKQRDGTVYSYVNVEEGKINGTETTLSDTNGLPTLCKYLVEHIGSSEIDLQSSSFKQGSYDVTITFNGAKVSSVRDYAITNDNVLIENSGSDNMSPFD